MNTKFKICKKSDLIIYITFTAINLLSLILHFILQACGIETGVNAFEYFMVVALVWLPLPVCLIIRFAPPIYLNICYQLFVILSYTFLSVWNGYSLITNIDLFVHFLSGVLFSLCAYSVYMTHNKDKNLNPFYVFAFIFAISLACGAIWEIGEFTVDSFGGNTQVHTSPEGIPYVGHKALENTFFDLIADFLGALVASIVCASVYFKKFYKRKTHLQQKESQWALNKL